MPRSLHAFWVPLAMFAAACDEGRGSASLILTPSGGKSETLAFGSRDGDGIELEPVYTGSSIQMGYVSGDHSRVLQGTPKMLVSTYNRVIDPTTTPVVGGEDRYGVGLMQGQVLLKTSAGGPVTTVATVVYIDEWRFTGRSGVSVKGRFAGDFNGLASVGEFEYTPDCRDALSPGGALCGDSGPVESFTRMLGPKRGYLYCPDVFLTPFVGMGAGAAVTYVPHRSVAVGGAELTFTCADTRGSAAAVLCGAEKRNVSWDGCAWHVYGLAMPWQVGDERGIQLWMGAVADRDCDLPITYCNTEWLDDGGA